MSGASDIPGFLLAADWTREVGVASYSVAAVLSLLAARSVSRRPGAVPAAWPWWGITVLTAALAVDVATGFRFEVTEPFREWVDSRGGNRDKVFVQMGAVAGLGFIALILVASLWRRRGQPGTAARVGVLLALVVWCAEVISLHGLSRVLYRRLGPVVLVAWLWLGAALLILGGAFRALRRPAGD